MARRQLLTDEERQVLLGIPPDADSLARLFTLSRVDRNLVAERRGDANRLGCAVQLALLRYPGTALAYLDQPPNALVSWMAGQLEIPAAAFAEYARRPQTMTDHARQLAATLRLRPPTMADLPPMIEAAADAARGTDHGQPIVAAVVAALRAAHIILPGAVVIERIAIAGRARARKRAADALVAGLSSEHLTKLDGLLVVDPSVGVTPFAWLKSMPIAPKADHIRELLDRLKLVRGIGVPAESGGHVHEGRLQQFVREGHASDAHQLGRYSEHRRRAILVATVLDLEARLGVAQAERGGDPHLRQALCHTAGDAPKIGQLHFRKRRLLRCRRQQQGDPAGGRVLLRHAVRGLGERLGRRDPDRDGNTGPLQHGSAQRPRMALKPASPRKASSIE